MSYDARLIADWFLLRADRDGKQLTQMKLQKLVYIAHGWYLGLTGRPLISDPVEAWKFGPVIRSLYRYFADYGANPIPTPGGTIAQIDQETERFLEAIWDRYKDYDAIDLSAMTHAPNTPWSQSYVSSGQPAVIPSNRIADHYRHLAATRK